MRTIPIGRDMRMTTFNRKTLEVLDEIRELLTGLVLESGKDTYLQGKSTAVTARSYPGAEPGQQEIMLSCHVPGHLAIDWTEHAIFLEGAFGREGGHGHREQGPLTWMNFLDPSGRVRFIVEATLSRFRLMPASAEGVFDDVALEIGFSPEDAREPSVEQVTKRHVSAEGLVGAQVSQHAGGIIIADFWTTDVRVSRGRVHLQFVSGAGIPVFAADAPFTLRDQAWCAHFELQTAEMPKDAVMRFAVKVPVDE